MASFDIKTFTLPYCMSAELSQQLAQELCSLKRQTALSKYLGLVLMYTSWRKGKADSLYAYLSGLGDAMFENPPQALHLMALPNVYQAQGIELSLDPALAQAAAQAAQRWAHELNSLMSLESDTAQMLKQLHERSAQAVVALFEAPVHLQLAQAMRMQGALNEHYPSMAQRPQPRSSGVHPNNTPANMARPLPLSSELLAHLVQMAVHQALSPTSKTGTQSGTGETGEQSPADNDRAQSAAGNATTALALKQTPYSPDVQALFSRMRERLVPGSATRSHHALQNGQTGQGPDGCALSGPEGSREADTTASGTPAAEAQDALASPLRPGSAVVQVFDPLHAARLLGQQAPGSAGPEGNALLRKTLHKMAHEGGFRKLHRQEAAPALGSLRARFPHFEAVLDHIEAHLALSGCGKAGALVQLPPMLLRGEPGCGKTFFAQELARELGLFFVERDLSVASDAFVLSGMDSGWKNSKPGVVFDTLMHQPWANPMICLNEIDKAKGSGHSNSPLSALYALLEPTSARQFTDEFVAMPINASCVNWVLTANHDTVPEPILSRLDVFELAMPNAEQTRQIAASVWSGLCENTFPFGHGFEAGLQDDSLGLLQTLSPRLLRKVLQQAAAAAVQAGRRELYAADIEQACAKTSGASKKPSIGFF